MIVEIKTALLSCLSSQGKNLLLVLCQVFLLHLMPSASLNFLNSAVVTALVNKSASISSVGQYWSINSSYAMNSVSQKCRISMCRVACFPDGPLFSSVMVLVLSCLHHTFGVLVMAGMCNDSRKWDIHIVFGT